MVGVTATDKKLYDAQQTKLGGWQAIAYQRGQDEISVGFMSDGGNFYATNPHDDSQYAVGARIGPGDVKFMDGLWLPDRETFVAAQAGTVALAATTTVETMPQDYPGVRYV
jgi:hypothetical protein